VYSVALEQLVGTEEGGKTLSEKATVYPNPAQTQLYFKSSSSEVFEGKIQLEDAMGRLVLAKNVKGQLLRDQVLDVSALPAGVYFLQATNRSGSVVVSEKVLKQ
jgi:hypothetical protein